FTVTPTSDISEAENDFTILQNAVGCAVDSQTIDLSGSFDWSATSSYANAAYLASYADTDYGDIRGLEIPEGVDDLTITSALEDAHIIGAGDVDDSGTIIYSSFLFGEDAPGNANLTIENLMIEDFESAITLGWNTVGSYNGTMIQNNDIILSGDNSDDSDWLQNIAFLFWVGSNQTIQNNTVTFQADGLHSGTSTSASFGYQSGTSGSGYSGLLIDENIFQVGDTSNGTERIYGIWENSHSDVAGTAIHLTNNQFLGRDGDDFDHAFRLTSQTDGLLISGNILDRVDEVFMAMKTSYHTDGDHYAFTGNTLTNVGGADGIFLDNLTYQDIPFDIPIYWDISNTIDGESGLRGLNELSTDATHAARPSSGATVIESVYITPAAITTTFVDDDWTSADRFSDPDGIGSGNVLAYGYNGFDTIQEGVDIVSDNGTVNVAAGNYAETIDIDGRDGINLIGEGETVVLIQPDTRLGWNACGHTTARTTAIRLVDSTNIALSGFTLDMQLVKADRLYGILACNSTGTLTDAKLMNNQLPDVGGAYNEFGMYVWGRDAPYNIDNRAHFGITDVTFQDLGRVAILAHDWTELDVDQSTFTKTEADFGYAVELGSASIGSFTNNTFTEFDTRALSDNSASGGLYIENCFTNTIVDPITKDVLISGNTFNTNNYGILIGNENVNYAGNVDINVVITDNEITNSDSGGVRITDEGKDLGSSVTVTASGNNIHDNLNEADDVQGYELVTYGNGDITFSSTSDNLYNNDIGLSVHEDTPSTSTYDVSIHFARIFSNEMYGIQNDVTSLNLIATNNWWGCNEGPTTDGSTDCDTYDGLVDADPWLVLNTTLPAGPLKIGEFYPVDASLIYNSDEEDTSLLGTITDWVKTVFTELLGLFTPAEENFRDGLVTSDYTPTASGAETICVTVDNESICEDRTILYQYNLPLIIRP
ncbi:MAG: right-handed parallel beta-helix repeat-containing protein, partial [Anaerolineaceae bacterium]|nr:right-handed parallel beta-helix repeat-containing protein [Anaerolineaceae bacterium]